MIDTTYFSSIIRIRSWMTLKVLDGTMANIDWTLTWNTVLAIATALMALAIVITAIFAIVQLWNIKKARYSDLLMRLDQIWDSKDYIRSRSMVNQHASGSTLGEASKNLKESLVALREAKEEDYFIMVRIANFFENLGFIIFNGYLNRKDALELFGSATRRYWRLFFDFVCYCRNESIPKQLDAWVYFENLSTGVPKENRCLKTIKAPIQKMRKWVGKNANR